MLDSLFASIEGGMLLFIFTLFLCFFFRNPQGLYGAYVKRQVKKGKITSGKNYFPQYFSIDEASIYAATITIKQGLDLFFIFMMLIYVQTIVIPILFICPVFILSKKIITATNSKKAEFQEKYGQNWKSIYRLYYCVGISDLIILGWKILGFGIIIIMFILSIFGDSRTEEEKRMDDLTRWQ